MGKRLKIFIGSSSEYVVKRADGAIDVGKSDNGKLKRIIEALKYCGFEPVPWYYPTVIDKHDSLLINLIKASKIYDGGVFILGKDIPKSERKLAPKRKLTAEYIPNSNVLLEMGMFLASKGIHRTFCVVDTDSKSQITLPSDIGGYIYGGLSSTNFKDEFERFFKKNKKEFSPKYDKITFYIGSELVKKQIKKEYVDWRSKGLYVGTESAIIWDQIESHDCYNSNIDFISYFIKRSVDNSKFDVMKIDNVVSLGPGNGKTDRALIEEIAKHNDAICYVPVDINSIMAFNASVNISKIPLRVPFAIIDDFEEHTGHISKIIDGKIHEIGENNLFSMLGVTFSNLENTEENLINKLKKWMGKNDILLIDALIKNGDTCEEVSENLRKTLFENASNRPDYKSLIINGVLKKYLNGKHSIQLEPLHISDIRDNVSNYFEIREIARDRSANYTRVDETMLLECVFKFKGNLAQILIAKRYDFDRLLKKLKEHFSVLDSIDGTKETVSINRGLFLLRKL